MIIIILGPGNAPFDTSMTRTRILSTSIHLDFYLSPTSSNLDLTISLLVMCHLTRFLHRFVVMFKNSSLSDSCTYCGFLVFNTCFYFLDCHNRCVYCFRHSILLFGRKQAVITFLRASILPEVVTQLVDKLFRQ